MLYRPHSLPVVFPAGRPPRRRVRPHVSSASSSERSSPPADAPSPVGCAPPASTHDFRSAYTTVAAVAKHTDLMAVRLARSALQPMRAGTDRLLLGIDDTPTPPLLWHGLPTMPLGPTEGLLLFEEGINGPERKGDLRSRPVAWSGDHATTRGAGIGCVFAIDFGCSTTGGF